MEQYLTPPVSGPRGIGRLAAIAAGYYTEIVEIIAPSEAAYGELVTVEVRVRNTWTGPFYIAVTGRYDGVDIPFSPDYAEVAAGATYSFFSQFYMPNNDIWVEAWSRYWTGTEWYQDDYSYIYIALTVPVAGTITRKELEYDETWSSIPVAENVPQGKRGIIHVWGRNDMVTNQKMGIYWFVADPEGYVAQEYGPYWEAFWTGPGNEQGFLSSRFDLDKVGKYTIWVELLMNPDDPEIVDRYIGDLSTVVAVVPEPEFRGFGVTEYTKR